MYIGITGDSDTVVNSLAQIGGLPSVTVLGKVDLSLTDITVKPSEKDYSAGLSAKITNWKAVKEAQLTVIVQRKADQVASVPISVETKVNLAPGWSGNFSGGLALDQNGLNNVQRR